MPKLDLDFVMWLTKVPVLVRRDDDQQALEKGLLGCAVAIVYGHLDRVGDEDEKPGTR
jgi:hypothetical protein